MEVHISASREEFPYGAEIKKFEPLFEQHGIEVAGKPLSLNYDQYRRMEREGRLIWVVARNDGSPIGYSCHFWYRSLHFEERIAADDIWFVLHDYRCFGIGAQLKKIGLFHLKEAKVTKTFDLIRREEHSKLMAELEYAKWGTRWVRDL